MAGEVLHSKAANMEKSKLISEVHELDDKHEGQDVNGNAADHNLHWRPGYVKQFPFIAAAALLVVVSCAIGCALVLCFSNNKSASQWPALFRPNVAVSVINVIGNSALSTALALGISVAWWIKAVDGTTISQLHESWRCSDGLLGVAMNIHRLDIIGLAVLVAKISVIDSVLYQRATTTYVGQDKPQNVTMLAAAATTFPSTGYVVAEGFAGQTQCNCFMIGDEYTPIVNTWQTSNGFFKGYNRYFQSCSGVCYSTIDAIGFEIDCATNVNDTDIAIAPIQAFDAANGAASSSGAWSDVPIFNSSFSVAYATGDGLNQTTIDLDLRYFQSSNPFEPSGETCQGAVTAVQCKLRPALVRYPIAITNFTNIHVTNGVSLGGIADRTNSASSIDQATPPYSPTLKQAEGFEVLSYLYPNETGELNSLSYLGGLANALHLALSSTATITYQGHGAWSLSQAGVLAQTMMYGPPNMGTCDCSFRDASLDTIIAGINQLAFLTSTGLIDQESVASSVTTTYSKLSSFSTTTDPITTVNTSSPLIVRGVASNQTIFFRPLEGTLQISDVNYYRTHFVFMGIGVGLTLLCVLTTSSLFWRYGTLGRLVSLDPIEIAGAFGAPILSSTASSNHDDCAGAGQAPDPLHSKTPAWSETHSRTSISGSMSAKETAAAPSSPRSPVPQTPASPVTFANLDHLLAAVGDRKVMYGVVDVRDIESNNRQTIDTAISPPSSPALSTMSNSTPVAIRRSGSQFLAFADTASGAVRPARSVRGEDRR